MPCVPCVCSTSLLSTDATPTCKRASPLVSRAFQSFPQRESQLVGGQLPRPSPPSPKAETTHGEGPPTAFPSPGPPLRPTLLRIIAGLALKSCSHLVPKVHLQLLQHSAWFRDLLSSPQENEQLLEASHILLMLSPL